MASFEDLCRRDDIDGSHNVYENPLVKRYASKEMSFVWSPLKKFRTWRLLWIALATAEKELGLDISSEQIEELKSQIDNIDWEYAAEKEKEFRHDVMGHVHAFGKVCPKSMPIIHLGATSCFVGDNTDLIQIRDSLHLICRKMIKLLQIMKGFAEKYKDLPTLGFTHYQPAQLTTVGKRCTLWMQDFVMDYQNLEHFLGNLPMRGVKGTTGTQATFLQLFEGNHAKVKELNKKVCSLMGFEKFIHVSGQTYPRKIDYQVLTVLSAISQSAYKMCGDIRLLANLKEIEEPFSKTQIGSSAMAYKRNPMRCERACSLARYVMNLPSMAAQTHSNQWFERTLDDSAIRRIMLPEAFLATDVVITLLQNISEGLHVWPKVIRSRIMAELPFMATENILMACVQAGGDRQELHELIRLHSMEAGMAVKNDGKPNDLLERIKMDDKFKAVHDKVDSLLDPSLFIGRCPQQVEEFLSDCVQPILEEHQELLGVENKDEVNV
mmetsp:Transcript_17396/g.25796  ORF Transcript_17396/g.25796 Transcript_17396/m.25796 type:complete len:494 (-) Transcript_17396:69-1550(-)|eukprot:CAMPEP_0171475150 /NCGR_PEP_ID=MMETSP0946-20130122/2835_1 /TAXON_ID=109269 /ORGANISM="Vaucheria litorea, Strain CCMP2940" /LENGTH=493 /DNA_ID=CAMNT_0012005189 /DNA_START=6 /DNA_END=1487 /DNA_ORIENTATION=-